MGKITIFKCKLQLGPLEGEEETWVADEWEWLEIWWVNLGSILEPLSFVLGVFKIGFQPSLIFATLLLDLGIGFFCMLGWGLIDGVALFWYIRGMHEMFKDQRLRSPMVVS